MQLDDLGQGFDPGAKTARPGVMFDSCLIRLGPDPLQAIRDGVIGRGAVIDGPFGPRRMIYADYVASGRALRPVEDWLMQNVLPWYANSHTEASHCGAMMTRMRRAARAAIADCTGAGPDHAVSFTGAGATAGINRLVHLLGAGPGTTVLIGPYEHHSNILPWRESGATVLTIPEGARGGPDPDALRAALARARGPVIGNFSAASNVTGTLTDVAQITAILKAAAKVVWDYAGGAPYLAIDMGLGMDAVVISPHKFIGGPGASGVMILRRDAVLTTRPSLPGGGTVRFVSPDSHDYALSLEAREEGGTPNVIGDIRAALVFLTKAAVGQAVIDARNAAWLARGLARLRAHPQIDLLGHPDAPCLPFFSFRIRDPRGGFIHQQLATRMLSDLHGVQTRGGCACAGPYVHQLLRLDPRESARLRAAILAGAEIEKPGFVRLNLCWAADGPEVDAILDAVCDLADRAPIIWRNIAATPDRRSLPRLRRNSAVAAADIVAHQRHPARAETGAAIAHRLNPQDVKHAEILPQPAMGQQHHVAVAVGQAQGPDLARGAGLVQVQIVDDQAAFLPQRAAQLGHVDRRDRSLRRLAKQAHGGVHGVAALRFRQGGDDARQGILARPGQRVVAQRAQAGNRQQQGLDLQPGKALRRQGGILGQGIAHARLAVDQRAARAQGGDVAIQLAARHAAILGQPLGGDRAGQTAQRIHQAHQPVGAGHAVTFCQDTRRIVARSKPEAKMLTLYHSPKSRSSSMIVLLDELRALDKVRIARVTIVRQDGSGGRDPANPHPEGKVPYLADGQDWVRERGAIVLYLTDMFPEAGLGPLPGDPKRGQYLSWLSWYQGVLEPVAILNYVKIDHPALQDSLRDYDTAIQRLDEVLTKQPWLLGDSFSAADLLVASPFIFFDEGMPRPPAVDAWVKRVQERPSVDRAAALD